MRLRAGVVPEDLQVLMRVVENLDDGIVRDQFAERGRIESLQAVEAPAFGGRADLD